MELQLLCKSLEEAWDNGKIYTDPAFAFADAYDRNVYMLSVSLENFKPNSGDILVGFEVRSDAPNMQNEIRVCMGPKVVAETNVVRGSKKMLDQPVSLIGLQMSQNITIDAPPYGIYAICAACKHEFRRALVQEKYVWGKWLYAGGVLQHADNATVDDSVPRLCVTLVKDA